MFIETERLIIIPLKAKHLKLWLDDIKLLEKELNCIYDAEPLIGHFVEVIKYQYDKLIKESEINYLYQSFWFIIRKTDRVAIGSITFKDVPNYKAEIEIGYGLGKSYEHNGYMTEAVKALCNFMLKQKGVFYIIAETDILGVASHHILEKIGFQKYKQDKTIWWRL